MKKTLKMLVRFFSLATFALLVAFGGLIGRFSRDDSEASSVSGTGNKLPQDLFSGFQPNVAHADAAPSDSGPSSDGDPGDGGPGGCDSTGDGPSDGC